MATTNLGRIGFVLKGNWAAGTYKSLDVVRHGTASFGCLAPTTTEEPSVTATDWQVIAVDGLVIGSDAAMLQTTGASVTVNTSAPPTEGQSLIATSPTEATWQDIDAIPDFLLIDAGII